ncbi:hypothetical protein [Zophobihabitans entericus]|uniref:Uncharacterized protein n=1 Tax=Zophobihabitans entericus TaxID=1635327 RepID=A0A6G9I9V3_9GAMM|nr:hypothetical protein [Zophobihabitans entericus]QIQ21001.1 hypothetical protein IPMB12_04485 [Zophobihabitans entericus]
MIIAKAYVQGVQRQGKQNIVSPSDELANDIYQWFLSLESKKQSSYFYEIDLVKIFNCSNQELAIAMQKLNFLSDTIKMNRNNINVYFTVDLLCGKSVT